ncbi:fimbria/pilus outer membrane usher protein [Klebsiella sp. 10982]|uniref:Outer membrane usher protein fimD n=1 Tax=Klebsiella quasivariicola TaxID=2026240 RepID=A0ABY6X983_9ENTR|nr:fimbria/pilus outer membrane usher protein [Klebsiella quasivariicola]QBL51864.1 fimbrial biogenesis outer membrane usher protein [Klebsiella sp. PO552]MBK2373471.1 fimbrial biogenesis outer membrane usher protein [Klebsiella quasivariicola]MCL7687249.1 fimbrial biogenesis outer membrane usher protein [Klebsiella quasivariicola]UDC41585.1 fimbrial biogenesis outer membrane usher protein [Klebsiella quasivariicola]VAN56855.1 type 1 fimbriae anchoring protein FimD [Klebsiella quasivariicola]
MPLTAGRALALATVPTMMFCLSPPNRALADDYFDPAALEFADPQQQTSDLHYFAKPGGQQPGTYSVTVVVNDQELGQADITFVDDGGKLQPVLTPAQLADYGVNVSAFPAFQTLHEGETFTRIEKFIPDASSRFTFANQRLTLSIPQAAMNVQSRGYVDPSRWDDGVPAAFVDYYFSGAQIKSADDGESSRSNYLNLRSGMNLGAWRLRNVSSMQYDQQRRHWDSQSTWLQRDVRSLKSLLRIGDTYTTGDVFDSIPFRGVQLMSDDEMLPDSQRGFAPTIRGVAHSNAKVTVSQHGYVIYETFVSPGAFAISDLYPTSQSGDLEVKVTESNGAVRTFTQPFSAVPFMLREGRGKFSLSAGRYHAGSDSVRSPEFLQGTLFYGLSAGFTLYGGTQLAQDYQSWALGMGRGFGEFGSLGGDVTQAVTRTPSGKRYAGHSLRAQYQKDFVSSGTSFSLASYRYSSSGYYDFAEASALESEQGQVDNRRRREELSVTQSLGGLGSLAISAWSQEYWHRQGQDETVHLGFYSAWKGISWGAGYYYTRSSDQEKNDRSWSFNINIPLGGPLSDSTVSYNTTSDSNGYTSQQVSLYGAMPTRTNLFYSVQQGYGNQGRGSNSSVALDYHGGFGNAQLGYRHDAASNQLTWGGAGSVVAHPHGITFGQTVGESFAIVRAPGAAGVAVQNGNNVRTDWRGYAVVPSLTAYRKNVITLDTESMADDTDVDQEGQTVIPGGGAVVMANYRTHIGNRVLFTLRNAQGPLPFGASARLVEEEESGNAPGGMVADGGQVYLSGVPQKGTLAVSWVVNNQSQSCTLHFQLPDNPQQSLNTVKTVSGLCQTR